MQCNIELNRNIKFNFGQRKNTINNDNQSRRTGDKKDWDRIEINKEQKFADEEAARSKKTITQKKI